MAEDKTRPRGHILNLEFVQIWDTIPNIQISELQQHTEVRNGKTITDRVSRRGVSCHEPRKWATEHLPRRVGLQRFSRSAWYHG